MTDYMMDLPLLISSIATHAETYHANIEVVSVFENHVERSTWKEVMANARQMASALGKIGLSAGDHCGTLAWNNKQHLELYFAISGSGMVCHTINPRLHKDQLVYIINDAGDKILFVEDCFLDLVESIRDRLSTVQQVVCLGSSSESNTNTDSDIKTYQNILNMGDQDYHWPELDERSPASLCYTSGTTGNPKGVMYTHRSTMLHTFGANQPDGISISARDCVMPTVPMFHANAWGVPYMAAAVGSKLVLPGRNLDGSSLTALINEEDVSMSLGVPTVWMGLLDELERSGGDVATLKSCIVGGAALPPALAEKFKDKYDVELIPAWGMTELSPFGSASRSIFKHRSSENDLQKELRKSAGRPPLGIALRVVNSEGATLPNDGNSVGHLQVKGLWVVGQYFNQENACTTDDGWFDTGDIASIDSDGYIKIRDRSKDIIKSGGEWISTVELEAIASSHGAVKASAAIAANHPKWGERPVVIVTLNSPANEQDLKDAFTNKIASWQVPDRIITVDELPIGPTGKILKDKLRESYSDILLEQYS